MNPRDFGSLVFKIAGIFAIIQAVFMLRDLLVLAAYPDYGEGLVDVPLLILGYGIPLSILVALGVLLIVASRPMAEKTILESTSAMSLRAVDVHAILFSVVGAFIVGYAAIEVPSLVPDLMFQKTGLTMDPDRISRNRVWALGVVLQLAVGLALLFKGRELALFFRPPGSE